MQANCAVDTLLQTWSGRGVDVARGRDNSSGNSDSSKNWRTAPEKWLLFRLLGIQAESRSLRYGLLGSQGVFESTATTHFFPGFGRSAGQLHWGQPAILLGLPAFGISHPTVDEEKAKVKKCLCDPPEISRHFH
jgi:hypothetical protein